MEYLIKHNYLKRSQIHKINGLSFITIETAAILLNTSHANIKLRVETKGKIYKDNNLNFINVEGVLYVNERLLLVLILLGQKTNDLKFLLVDYILKNNDSSRLTKQKKASIFVLTKIKEATNKLLDKL